MDDEMVPGKRRVVGRMSNIIKKKICEKALELQSAYKTMYKIHQMHQAEFPPVSWLPSCGGVAC